MEYRQNDWSILGFGCMRFPKKGGSVDMKETERELAYAIAHGVNYFDTAYIYRGNEKVLGELVAKNHWRAQIQIATKMPHYLIHSIDELEKLFCEQLKRLQTDYVDNYLMHMLPDVHIWKKSGWEFLTGSMRKRKTGRFVGLDFPTTATVRIL